MNGVFGLNDVLRAIRARWWVIIGAVIAGLAVAGALHAGATRTYVSTTELLISVPRTTDAPSAYQGALFTKERMDSYARILTTSQLAQGVVDDLGTQLTADEVADKVTALPVPDTDILEVTVRDTTPQRAQAIAASLTRQFDQTVTALETPDAAQGSLVAVDVIEPATFEPTPEGSSLAQDLLLGAALGLLAGLGIALLRQRLDPTVRTTEDTRHATGTAVTWRLYEDRKLSHLPLPDALDGQSSTAKALRAIRLNLEQAAGTDRPQVIVVTSAAPGEGKSTVAVGLSVSLARSGSRVLLVEGNVWRPRVLRYLGLTAPEVGLTDVLSGSAALAGVTVPSRENSLSVLPAGPMPDDPGELLGSEAMRALIGTLRETYDHVVIDAPALLPVIDAAALAAVADGCLVVATYGTTQRDELAEAATALAAVRGRVLGVVLNRVPVRTASSAERRRYKADAGRRSSSRSAAPLDTPHAPSDDQENDVLPAAGHGHL